MNKTYPFSMTIPFISTVKPPKVRLDPAYWFVFRNNKLVVEDENASVGIPFYRDLVDFELHVERRRYMGTYKGLHCYVVDVHEGASLPDAWKPVGLRELFGHIEDDLFTIAGRATQILHWDKTHQYCGGCGSRAHDKAGELAKECPKCGLLFYPRISPAIITAVRRGHEILLARSHRHREGLYTTLAGFVEPGETLEGAVIREVKEEVNIEATDIRYFASQPWPFPHSLMIGFTATFASGKIRPDRSELEDVRWFSADNLPEIPSKVTIARRLIDDFLAETSTIT